MGEIVKAEKKFVSVRQLIESQRSQIAAAFPRAMSVDRFLRVTLTSLRRTPQLVDCEPTSLLGALIQCAQLGLEPDGVLGDAYLVPFKREVQLLVGYKGLMRLARQSGEISTIAARAVHAGDQFVYRYTAERDELVHEPSRDPAKKPGELTHAYAIARLKDGAVQFDVMARWRIEEIRSVSRSKDSSPWRQHYDEMACKTVLRHLCKQLPSSVALAQAVALDERAEAGLPQEIIITPEAAPSARADALDSLSDAIEGKAAEAEDAGEEPWPEAFDGKPPAEEKSRDKR